MTYHNNCLHLNGKEIIFQSKIYNVTRYKSYVFVLIGFDFDVTTHCNIYCFSQDGNELWKIKKHEVNEVAKNMKNAYIGLRVVDGDYAAVNFYNEVVHFNPFNGRII